MSSKKKHPAHQHDHLNPEWDPLKDEACEAFTELVTVDDAEIIGSVAVDSGQIQIGDCGKVQVYANTAYGDGYYPVWRGKKYLVIPIDFIANMRHEDAIRDWCEENKEELMSEA
jgi:hypothetical protein|tara:strand:+ start:165 stop:506 length:342 start_codon:yes stop_codon:yes gene_type:complete